MNVGSDPFTTMAIRRSVFILMLMLTRLTCAQVSSEEHEAHHPDTPADVTPSTQPDDTRTETSSESEMGGMMERMGAPPPLELYPSLMSLPDLPPEVRHQVQLQAHDRMTAGTELMSRGLGALATAASSDDFAAMQAATAALREGLAQFESGLAAHRAIAEGKAPRNVALQWFKREMNLVPPAAMQTSTVLGLSRTHFTVMVILVMFAMLTTVVYFRRMRRATDLVAQIASGHPGPPPVARNTEDVAATANPGLRRPVPSEDSADEQNSDINYKRPVTALAPSDRQTHVLRVSRIFQESKNIKTFRFTSPDGGPIPFRYLPGQFLTLTVSPDAKPARRSYTIASSPTQRHYCEITVKREDMGLVSRFLHDVVNEGDSIEVSGPSGRFTFTGREAHSIVLIGGGVGVTPLMSVIRYLCDIAWEQDIYLLYSCRTSGDFAFRGELEQLQRRHDNLHVVATMTREPGTVWMGLLSDRFSRDVIAQSVPDIAARRVHLCGPPPMMDAITEMLDELGVPPNQVHTELFGGTTNTSTSSATTQLSDDAVGAHVEFKRSDISALLPPTCTILDVADTVGVQIDSSCRNGTCGTCTVTLLSGDVTMECEDGLTPDDRKHGMVLACQAKATQDIVVDA